LQESNFFCQNSFSNPGAIAKLDDCKVGYGSASRSCDTCDNGFALNINYQNDETYTEACIPDADCNAASPQMFFEEKTYFGGTITRKYCTNCPTNC
jgi:hypothetical protein